MVCKVEFLKKVSDHEVFKDGDNRLDVKAYPTASKDVFQTMVEYIYYKDLDLPDKN